MNYVLTPALARPAPTTASECTAKEHVEDVHWVGGETTVTASFFEGLLSAPVIYGAFVGIRKNFVGLRNLFELYTKRENNQLVTVDTKLQASHAQHFLRCYRLIVLCKTNIATLQKK